MNEHYEKENEENNKSNGKPKGNGINVPSFARKSSKAS
jgi:hypothetical protein